MARAKVSTEERMSCICDDVDVKGRTESGSASGCRCFIKDKNFKDKKVFRVKSFTLLPRDIENLGREFK